MRWSGLLKMLEKLKIGHKLQNLIMDFQIVYIQGSVLGPLLSIL